MPKLTETESAVVDDTRKALATAKDSRYTATNLTNSSIETLLSIADKYATPDPVVESPIVEAPAADEASNVVDVEDSTGELNADGTPKKSKKKK